MTRPKTSIAERLNAANIAINNAQNDPEIMAALAGFKFDSDAFAEGRQLHEAALRAVEAQQDALGRQRQATAHLDDMRVKAETNYQGLASIARNMLGKPDQLRLGLDGKMPVSVAGFLVAAQTLFDNARLEDVQMLLAARGYNRVKLDHEYIDIAAYDTANQAQKAAIGAAQLATRAQREALNALNRWMSQLRSAARVAFRENPQFLEKLGFFVRNSPSAAQRRARSQQNGEHNETPSNDAGEESDSSESQTPDSP